MDLLSRGSLRQATIESLKEQLKTLHKRIAAFDELTGEKRQSKSTFDMAELVDDVLSNHAREFERHGIQLRLSRPDRDRKSVVQGKSVSVRVDLGGRRIIKKKKERAPDNTTASRVRSI